MRSWKIEGSKGSYIRQDFGKKEGELHKIRKELDELKIAEKCSMMEVEEDEQREKKENSKRKMKVEEK